MWMGGELGLGWVGYWIYTGYILVEYYLNTTLVCFWDGFNKNHAEFWFGGYLLVLLIKSRTYTEVKVVFG